MSNDLISRSMLSKNICNRECNVPEFQTDAELNAFLLGLNAKQIAVMECISDIPTTYDVDKVVECLEEQRNKMYRADGSLMSARINISIDKAIEIIKSGGAD